MKVVLQPGVKPSEEDEFTEGVEFDIREDSVYITIGNLYVRVDIEDMRKVSRILE